MKEEQTFPHDDSSASEDPRGLHDSQSSTPEEEPDKLVRFGELREIASTPKLQSPKEISYLATAAIHCVGDDTPSVETTTVYIDIDAMLEVQEHASEDTSVELGGILLGRRGNDATGRAIVIISDSLRARHYRATRGSFTFTHETWSDLRSQRERLGESLDIIGWYHTHPGWGVFLSSMDVFICDHFFSHLDDIAMVVDPKNRETGCFVRRGFTDNHSPGRLNQYYLFGHRTRESELGIWSQYFSSVKTIDGDLPMPQQGPEFPRRLHTPIINQPPTNQGDLPHPGHPIALSQPVFLIGIIFLQTFIFAVTVGVMLYVTASKPQQTPADALVQREAIIDEILASIADQREDGLGKNYRTLAIAKTQTEAANLGLQHRVTMLETALTQREQELAQTTQERDDLSKQTATASWQKANPSLFGDTLKGLWSPSIRPAFLLGILVGCSAMGLLVGIGLWRGELARRATATESHESN